MINTVKLLSDKVMNPAKYYWVIGMPGQFDAAEKLYNDHWDELPANVANKVETVLQRSGKYLPVKG